MRSCFTFGHLSDSSRIIYNLLWQPLMPLGGEALRALKSLIFNIFDVWVFRIIVNPTKGSGRSLLLPQRLTRCKVHAATYCHQPWCGSWYSSASGWCPFLPHGRGSIFRPCFLPVGKTSTPSQVHLHKINVTDVESAAGEHSVNEFPIQEQKSHIFVIQNVTLVNTRCYPSNGASTRHWSISRNSARSCSVRRCSIQKKTFPTFSQSEHQEQRDRISLLLLLLLLIFACCLVSDNGCVVLTQCHWKHSSYYFWYGLFGKNDKFVFFIFVWQSQL